MAESSHHQELIQRMVDFVPVRFGELYSLTVRHDLSQIIGAEKPPRIGDHTPDLFAIDVPLTTMVIGEAKTSHDLETEHSRNQYASFIKHLSGQPRGVFVLSITLNSVAPARRVLASVVRKIGTACDNVEMIILHEFGTWEA